MQILPQSLRILELQEIDEKIKAFLPKKRMSNDDFSSPAKLACECSHHFGSFLTRRRVRNEPKGWLHSQATPSVINFRFFDEWCILTKIPKIPLELINLLKKSSKILRFLSSDASASRKIRQSSCSTPAKRYKTILIAACHLF